MLFVCPFVPWPLVTGGKIRTYHLIKEASRHADIHLRILREPEPTPGAEEALAPWCASLELFDRSAVGPVQRLVLPKLERWFHSVPLHRRLAEDLAPGRGHDSVQLVHLDELLLARVVPPDRGVPVVQHHHKLDTVLYDTLSSDAGVKRHFDLWKLRRLERESARRYRHHLLCSEGDAAILRERYGALDTCALPSGFDPEAYRPSDPPVEREPDRLLFLGSMDYGPNVDGVRWFVEQVLPRVRSERPGVRFEIVGRDPAPEVRALERPEGNGVRVVGSVPSVHPWLEGAALLVVPLRIGGGTRLKIVEALAHGTPVVSTRTGAEGLELADGEHLSLADDPAGFAATVLEHLADRERSLALGRAGQRKVHAAYRWPVLGEELVDYWERIAFSGKVAASR